VAKGCTQIFGLDYSDTFSPHHCLAFITMIVIRHWPFYQLDIKNVFLYGKLSEDIYMEKPPLFVAQVESCLACKL